MGIEIKTTNIGGTTYRLETFGAKKGMSILLTLARFIGPAFARVATEGPKDIERALTGALESFALTAKEEDLTLITDAFAAKCKVEIQTTTKAGVGAAQVDLAPIFDSHFAGGAGLKNMAQWLAWCVKENYGDFLAGSATDLLGTLRQNPNEGSSQSPVK